MAVFSRGLTFLWKLKIWTRVRSPRKRYDPRPLHCCQPFHRPRSWALERLTAGYQDRSCRVHHRLCGRERGKGHAERGVDCNSPPWTVHDHVGARHPPMQVDADLPGIMTYELKENDQTYRI